jgi:hypothetical protein
MVGGDISNVEASFWKLLLERFYVRSDGLASSRGVLRRGIADVLVYDFLDHGSALFVRDRFPALHVPLVKVQGFPVRHHFFSFGFFAEVFLGVLPTKYRFLFKRDAGGLSPGAQVRA